jgi:uncharacterized membrane protein
MRGWFDNLKIRNKRIVLMTGLLTGSLALTAVTIRDMSTMAHQTDAIADEWLPQTSRPGERQAALLELRLLQFNHVVSSTAEQRTAMARALATARDTVQARLATEEQRTQHDDDRRLAATLQGRLKG